MVCILKDMQTITIVYKLSVTNLEFTLGLTENIDSSGKKVNDFFLPMSLRVEEISVERSKDGDIVDFIFSKNASNNKYDKLSEKLMKVETDNKNNNSNLLINSEN